MDADLQHKTVAMGGPEVAHRLAHTKRRGDGSVRGRECRHHRITAGLDHRTRLSRNNFVQHPEMCSYELEGYEVANSLVELGRASQVGEQERQAGDFEPLIKVDHVG